jgi:hypothetical protein
LDVQPLEKVSSEMGDELRASVGDGIDGEAMEFPNVLTVQLGSLFRSDIRGSGDKMSHFCKAVHTHEDRVITVRGGQFDNEVHGDRLPWSSGNRKRLEIPKWGVAWNLIAYTGFAGVDILVDELSHPRPIIIPR